MCLPPVVFSFKEGFFNLSKQTHRINSFTKLYFEDTLIWPREDLSPPSNGPFWPLKVLTAKMGPPIPPPLNDPWVAKFLRVLVKHLGGGVNYAQKERFCMFFFLRHLWFWRGWGELCSKGGPGSGLQIPPVCLHFVVMNGLQSFFLRMFNKLDTDGNGVLEGQKYTIAQCSSSHHATKASTWSKWLKTSEFKLYNNLGPIHNLLFCL